MGQFRQDLRFGIRSLARSPGFTAVALATIALGIGANTAIFSVVEAVLLRPLPYPGADRLVSVTQAEPSRGVSGTGASYPNFADWQARAKSFEHLSAIRMHDYTLTGRGDPALVTAGTVTSNLFRTLEGPPLLGRTLMAADDDAAAPPVAVLGERLWRSRFAADAGIVGRTILLDQQPVTVVGVMPARFKTPPETPSVQLWLTLTHDPVFGDLRAKREGHYLRIVGKLRPGVPIESARAELATIQDGLAREHPKANGGWIVAIEPLAESLVSGVRTALLVLLGAVALVFAIACANVSNLLLARASARSREVAIRTALGAGRARLLRQFLTEGLLLAAAGGILGVALAFAALRGITAWLPADLPRVDEIHLDGMVLLFACAATLLAAAAFGLAPALQSSSAGLFGSLKEGSAGTGEAPRRRRLRSFLVGAETALSFVLLIGAGLLTRSFLRMQEVPLGFRPSGVLTAGLSLPRTQYSRPDQWLSFYGRLVERLKTEPGVESVAAALPLPLTGSGLNFAFTIEGRPSDRPGADLSANYTAAMPEYLRVLGLQLRRGRWIAAGDSESAPKVCVISERFARLHFPGEDPIGRRLVFGFADRIPRTIVGVVADVRRDGLAVVSRPEMYVPFAQEPWWAAYLAIRAAGDPSALTAAVRNAVASLDPSMPVDAIQPMSAFVTESVAQPRFRTTLLSLFGATALLLAVVGLYGLIAYDVGRRAREIGLRLALGAGRGDVIRLVLRQGLTPALFGLAAGLAGAVFVTRFLSSLLFETTPLDPATYASVAAVLLAAGLAACWIPARRALAIDPMRVLRSE
jgi:putative ABC transport system permease protein